VLTDHPGVRWCEAKDPVDHGRFGRIPARHPREANKGPAAGRVGVVVTTVAASQLP
jgi:hypothetical protein